MFVNAKRVFLCTMSRVLWALCNWMGNEWKETRMYDIIMRVYPYKHERPFWVNDTARLGPDR